MLKETLTKLIAGCILITFFTSCNVVKRVGPTDYLLTESSFYVNGQKRKTEELSKLSFQKKNTQLLGIPIQLHIYNLARPKKDSLFDLWLHQKPKREKKLISKLSKKQLKQLRTSSNGFNRWLKETGEKPNLLDSLKINKTLTNLERYYFSNGWFDREIGFKVDTVGLKKAELTFEIKTGNPYHIGSVSEKIESPVIDSLYKNIKTNSKLKKGEQFLISNFEEERSRLTTAFRNLGAYHFSQDYIRFENDTIDTKNKVNITVQIQNRIIRNDDSIVRVPFKTYKIKEVNIFTDATFKNRSKKVSDSATFNNYNVYAYEKLKYKPKSLTNAVLIAQGNLFKDIDRSRTYRYLNELSNFKYPNIEYIENAGDSTLTANIYLIPKKKYGLGFNVDVSQSNIQKVGFSFTTGVVIRNIFKGAETLQISALGAIGASKDGATTEDRFFDINELGADIKLRIPRILFPINLENVIPKRMNPTTDITLGASLQQNIGLDKQYFGSSYQVKWAPNKMAKVSFKIIDLEFINNQNTSNYFNVYRNSFDKLNSIAGQYNNNSSNINNDLNLKIPEGATTFIDEVLSDKTALTPEDLQYQDVNRIRERQNRLTANNLIIGSSLGINYNSQESILDESFFQLQGKLSLVGSLLNQILKSSGADKNELGQYEIDGVAPSQHIKTELHFIKHWQTSVNSVLAFRAFGGIAIPFGNAQSIPFSRSYFSGGSNDNRAWRAYRLGPGSSNNLNEFNEANFKLTFNLEYRFPIVRKIKGALLIDAGNIWNVLDDVDDPAFRFDGLKDLNEIAVGTGFGLRYDFNFFVFRLDTGFKTHNPALSKSLRWGGDYSIKSAVFNIGINYPF